MASAIPKQFIEIGGRPILMWTIEAFHQFGEGLEIIVVLPKKEQANWSGLVRNHHFEIAHQVVEGGHSRFASVKNGLNAIPNDKKGVVAIHDGVRPLVSQRIIKDAFEIAENTGCAIASVSLKESVRKQTGESSHHVPRDEYRLIQTPQAFTISGIKAAFLTEENDIFTDDASVYEANGGIINLFEGEYKNIKITTPDDLVWAKALLEKSTK